MKLSVIKKITVMTLSLFFLQIHASSEDIKIGMSADLNGKSKELGINMKLGIEACFKEINDAGIKSYMFVGTTNNNIETGEVEKVYSWPQVYFKIKEFTKKTQ